MNHVTVILNAKLPSFGDKFITFNSITMNMKTLFAILVIWILVFFAACKKDTFKPVTNICPLILQTSPPNGSTGVPLGKVITATFNKEMDESSITEVSFFVLGSVVPGKVTYNNKVASFTPTQPLQQNHTYVGHIKTLVKDFTGNHLQNEYTWTFSTGSILNPVVVKTDPDNLEIGVDINKTISATFNTPMNAGSIDSSFRLMQGSNRVIGVFSYYDTTAYFIPAVPLLSGTNYTGIISTGATDVAGIPLQSDYVWTFTTHRMDPPVIIETDPIEAKIDVALNTQIHVYFDVPMDPNTINSTSFYLKKGSILVDGSISAAGNEAIFTPTVELLPQSDYTFYVQNSVKNTKGIRLFKDSIWSFKTGVLVAPTVSSTNPINNAVNIPLSQAITTVFSVPMDPSSLTSATFLLKQGLTPIAGVVSTLGNVSTFTPTTKLIEGLQYTATMTTGTKNLAGTALANNYSWKFTTVTIPKITQVDPVNLATSVELNKIIHATFNMQMKPTTLNNSTVQLKDGATIISCGIGYSGTSLSIAPANELLPSKVYTVVVTTGAENLAGVPMAADYNWSFTTGTVKAPIVKSTSPLNNASNVDLSDVISATFNEPMQNSSIVNTSFILKLGGSSVSGTVYTVNNTAYFQPGLNLISGKTYTATITTDVKNSAGVKMANNYTWTFSTKQPLGPQAPNLNEVSRYGIIAGTAVSNNAGFSKINNLDVGIYPGVRSSITGFPPAVIVNGSMHASDDVVPLGIAAQLLKAKTDLTAAYLYAEGATTPAPVSVSGDQGGKTLAPGIYKTTSTLLIQNGDLTLDAQGDVNAVWIFQIASTLTTIGGAGGDIVLSGGAQAKNVYWQVGSSATIGGYTIFKGNILALTSITMGVYSTADGRMLARNAAVTMTSTNIINKP